MSLQPSKRALKIRELKAGDSVTFRPLKDQSMDQLKQWARNQVAAVKRKSTADDESRFRVISHTSSIVVSRDMEF